MKRSFIAASVLCAFVALFVFSAIVPQPALARVEGDCESFDSGIKNGNKDYGVTWEDLAFVAQGADGMTADGTPGITVSEPEVLTEDFSAPATYTGSVFSNNKVTGAAIDATKVVTITVPADVLNIGDTAARSLVYKNESSEEPEFREGASYAYYTEYGESAVNWARIQACFDYAYKAYDDGATDTLFRVVLPKGTYEISGLYMGECFHIYNNTWVDMTAGTKLVQLDQKVAFARSGFAAEDLSGYERKNIILDGGTWVGLKNEALAHSVIILGHVKNAVVRNVTFDSASNGHHLEFDGVSGANIYGCEFKNYYGEKNKEAFQLDIAGAESAETFPLHDYTTTKNIVIYNNKFHDLSRGLGTHYTYTGHVNSEVLIKKNSFTNMRDEGIFLTAFDNVAVLENTFTACARGIRSTPIIQGSGHYEITGDAYHANGGYLIEGNTFGSPVSGEIEDTYAMFFYGNVIDGKTYALKNVLIRKNVVNASGVGLRLSRVTGVTVSGGSIDASAGYGLLARTSCAVEVQGTPLSGKKAAVQSDSNATVTVNGSMLESSKGPGVATEGGSVIASGCTLVSGGSYGAQFDGGEGQLSNCTINPTSGYGVYASNSADVAVADCDLCSNKKGGAYAKGANLSLTSCALSTNGTYGAVATSSAKLTCSKCSIKNNASHGVSAKSGSTFAASSCAINSNSKDGVYASSATVTLKSCDIKANASRGAELSSSKATIKSCNVKKNMMHGIELASSTGSVKNSNINSNAVNGICAASSTAKLSGTSLKANKGNGVYGKASTAALSSCTVSSNKLYGAYANGGSVTVKKGKVTSNKKDGVFAKKGALTCSKATVQSNAGAGVQAASSTVSVKSCTVVKNGKDGVSASKGCAVNSFKGNKVKSNKGYGLKASGKTTVAGGAKTVAAKNSFKSNKKGALHGVKDVKKKKSTAKS